MLKRKVRFQSNAHSSLYTWYHHTLAKSMAETTPVSGKAIGSVILSRIKTRRFCLDQIQEEILYENIRSNGVPKPSEYMAARFVELFSGVQESN